MSPRYTPLHSTALFSAALFSTSLPCTALATLHPHLCVPVLTALSARISVLTALVALVIVLTVHLLLADWLDGQDELLDSSCESSPLCTPDSNDRARAVSMSRVAQVGPSDANHS